MKRYIVNKTFTIDKGAVSYYYNYGDEFSEEDYKKILARDSEKSTELAKNFDTYEAQDFEPLYEPSLVEPEEKKETIDKSTSVKPTK